MFVMRLASALVAIFFMTAPVSAEALSPADAVSRLFTGKPQADWLSDDFRREVPVSDLAALIDRLTGEFGALRDVSGSGDRLTVRLERAEVPARVLLDSNGRISGLFFEAPIPLAGNLADHVATIAALPGESAALVMTDGEVVAAHQADVALAIGSTAKLAILRALRETIDDGRLAWDTVVSLDPAWRSLASGVLQDWPAETPLTIATLANLMISISDNTATDALIDLVGRAPIEAISPRNTPFPNTAELFKLKAPANAALRDAFARGDAPARRRVLDELAELPLPDASEIGAVTPEIEWFMTAREACALLDTVADLPAMAIAPGLASRDDWQGIAYKGGSDAGVLNFSTRLVGKDGRVHCVSATWNNAGALAAESLATPYRGILRTLAEG